MSSITIAISATVDINHNRQKETIGRSINVEKETILVSQFSSIVTKWFYAEKALRADWAKIGCTDDSGAVDARILGSLPP